MRILILGGAGFIGANLARFILYTEKSNKIFLLDKLQKIESIHNVYMNKSAEFYLADISDQDITNKIFILTNPDVVISLIPNITTYVHTIINNCKKHNCKFIYVSCNNDDEVKEYIKKYSTNYNILNIPQIFGPRQNMSNILDMYMQLKTNKEICLHNKGTIINDLLHVEDLSNAIHLLMNNWENLATYNISFNMDYTQLEIASMIVNACGYGKISFYKEPITEPNVIQIDNSKIKSIGWKPIKNFKQRIKETIYWFNNNSWFIKE